MLIFFIMHFLTHENICCHVENGARDDDDYILAVAIPSTDIVDLVEACALSAKLKCAGICIERKLNSNEMMEKQRFNLVLNGIEF